MPSFGNQMLWTNYQLLSKISLLYHIYNFLILKKQSANYFLYFGSNHSPLNFQHTFQHFLCQNLSFSIYLERFFLFQGACHIFKPNVKINYCSSSNPCKGPKEICSHVSLKTGFLIIIKFLSFFSNLKTSIKK